MRKVLAAALTVATITPVSLQAQSVADLCQALGKVTVGQWVQYEMKADQIPGGKADMRFAIVGTEQTAGSDHYWFEIKMNTTQGAFISQLLVPGYPYETSDVKGMIMKMGDQPAMKMPPQMLNMMQRQNNNQAMELAQKCEGAEELGWESVTVPAGTMRALHLRATDNSGEMWVTDAFPFGMVKWVGNKGEELVLLGHGKDATSSITETPKEMPGM